MGVSKTGDHIQIMIKMPKPNQEHPAPFKAPERDLKEMIIICTFKIKIESLNFENECIKDQWPYPNQDQPNSGIFSILQSPNQHL